MPINDERPVVEINKKLELELGEAQVTTTVCRKYNFLIMTCGICDNCNYPSVQVCRQWTITGLYAFPNYSTRRCVFVYNLVQPDVVTKF